MFCMIFNQILFDFERSDQLLYTSFYHIPHFFFRVASLKIFQNL